MPDSSLSATKDSQDGATSTVEPGGEGPIREPSSNPRPSVTVTMSLPSGRVALAVALAIVIALASAAAFYRKSIFPPSASELEFWAQIHSLNTTWRLERSGRLVDVCGRGQMLNAPGQLLIPYRAPDTEILGSSVYFGEGTAKVRVTITSQTLRESYVYEGIWTFKKMDSGWEVIEPSGPLSATSR